jgi:hypothetical protein
MRQFVNDSVNGYLVEVICATDVSVNPRYGSWSNETCDGASPRLPSVVPPEGPASQEPEPSFPFEG